MPQTYAPIIAGAGGILLEAPDTLPSSGVLALAVDAAGKMSSVAFPSTTRETLGLATTDSPTFAGLNFTPGLWNLNPTGSFFGLKKGSTTIIQADSGYLAFARNLIIFGEPTGVQFHIPASYILEQRNGTNGQKSRLYKTYTSATSGEWLEMDAATDASNFDIAASIGSAGGSARGIRIGGKNAAGTFTSWLSFGTAGAATFSNNNNGIVIKHASYNTLLTCQINSSANGYLGVSSISHILFTGSSSILQGNVVSVVAGNGSCELNAYYNLKFKSTAFTADDAFIIYDGATERTKFHKSGLAVFTGTINGRASTTAAATAPIKIATGVLMTTPEAGAIEYDGTNYYGTNSVGRGAFARGGDSPTFAGVTLTGQSLTGSESTALFDLATTWNTTGTPSAFKLNVTDTASNAASLLMDLQVGGISQAAIRKDGRISVGPIVKRDGVSGETFGLELGNGINAGASAHAYIRLKTNWGDASISSWGGAFSFSGAGVTKVVSPAFSVNSSGSFGFSSGTAFSASDDVILHRDAAATLAQRNSTTGQKSRLYKTYTSATSGEWLELDAATDASNFDIAASIGSAGGTARGIRIGGKNAAGTFASWLSFATSGAATFSGNLNPLFANSGDIGASARWGHIYLQYDANVLRDFVVATSYGKVRWSIQSVGFSAPSLGLVEINNGTLGTLRDLSVRAATFSGTINGRASTTSASTAPIKIATGVLMTTPEAGAIEYDGTNLYFTDSGGVRRQLAVV